MGAMTARSRAELDADGEARETLESALVELNKLVPTGPAWVKRIEAARVEILQELREFEKQGSLF
jgi:hypothetical protein